MSEHSHISWTDATWNPVLGCSKVSPGCAICYAVREVRRLAGNPNPKIAAANEGLVERHGNGQLDWSGIVRLIPERLDEPLRWKKPRRVFVNSMSDVFHESLPDDSRDKIFAVIALASQHVFQSLTKRPENQRRYISDPETPFRVQRAMDRILVDSEMRRQKEVWRKVFLWPDYEVSNFGEIRRAGMVLAQASHSHGYRQVALCNNGHPVTRLVHTIVLESFVGAAPEGHEAAHRNGDKTDNRLANLRWATRTENMSDASRHGTAGAWMKGRATLTPGQVSEIRRRRELGERLDDIAADFGNNRKQISKVAKGNIFKPAELPWPLPNIWLGVSVENQATADERLPTLLQTPAAVRFVSFEPALSHIDFRRWLPNGMQAERELCVSGGPERRSGNQVRRDDLATQEARMGSVEENCGEPSVRDREGGARLRGLLPGEGYAQRKESLRSRPQAGMETLQGSNSSGTDREPRGRPKEEEPSGQSGTGDVLRTADPRNENSESGTRLQSGRPQQLNGEADHGTSSGDTESAGRRRGSIADSGGLRDSLPNGVQDRAAGPTLDLIIIGGESGPGARQFNLEWARSVISQCKAAGVSVFCKQLGAKPYEHERYPNGATMGKMSFYNLKDRKGGDINEFPEDLRVREFPRI